MITLASDFGSPYPAAMKGAIARRSDARVVDVAHDLPHQDVRAAAFWLRFVLPEFPPAVHCAVVDPGVGTDRAALAVRAGDHALVGPDNGSLLPVARELAAAAGDGTDGWEAFEIEVATPDSATFHGRDVFAPAAARIHDVGVAGVASLDGLTPVSEVTEFDLPDGAVHGDGAEGEVLVVDDFGNVITNVPGTALAGRVGETVHVEGHLAPVVHTFSDVAPGERLVSVGSHGYVECDVNQGRGDEAFGLAPGDRVRIEFDE